MLSGACCQTCLHGVSSSWIQCSCLHTTYHLVSCLYAVVSAESSPPKPAFLAAARVRSAVLAAPGSNRSHAHPAAESTAVCARCAATAAAVAAPHSAAPLPALPPPVASHRANPPPPAPPAQGFKLSSQ